MAKLQGRAVPAIGQKGVSRLMAMTRETKMQPDCTLFTAGYEQAKREFRDAIRAEVGNQDAPAAETHLAVPLAERRAQAASTGKKYWWMIG